MSLILSNTDFSDGEFSDIRCYEIPYLECSRVLGNFVTLVEKYCRFMSKFTGLGILRFDVSDGTLFESVLALSIFRLEVCALVVV